MNLYEIMLKVWEDCQRMAEYVREHQMYDPLIDGPWEKFLAEHPGVRLAPNLMV